MIGVKEAFNEFVYRDEELTWSIVAKIAGFNELIDRTITNQVRRTENEENLIRIQALIRNIEALEPSPFDNGYDYFLHILIVTLNAMLLFAIFETE